MKLEGIHHVTAITADAPRNVDFYARVLGLRLVKKTVNQDDPTVYHLFYADEQGERRLRHHVLRVPRRCRAAARAPAWCTASCWRVGSRGGARLLGASGWAARASTSERDGRRPALRRPRGAGARAAGGRDRRRAADRRPSRDPGRARPAGLRRRPRLRGRAGAPAARSSRRRSASSRAGDGAWEARGEERGSFYAYDEPPAERGISGRRHGAPRRLGLADGGARGLARARGRGRRAADAGDRPLLLPLDLLPRAERRAVRDRHARPGLHRRRAAGARSASALSLPPAYEHLRERLEQVLTPLPDPRPARTTRLASS